MIGHVINKRYQVVDKLGYGGYSTVWMTRDMQQDTYVALKIGVADSRVHETTVLKRFLDAAPRTAANSTALVGLTAIPRVLDAFTVRGPNGEHPSYTTALAGTNLRDACDLSMFRLEVARALAVKLVSAIAYVHSRGYAHGDIHLGNVMLRLPPQIDELSVEQLYQKYGHPEIVPYGGPTLNKAFDDWLHKNRLEFEVGSFSEEEKTAFLQLLQRMLSYDPLQRPTADEVLKSGWIANWAMDDFEKSRRMSHDSSDRPANMLSVAEYQSIYDEISEIRQAAKKDFSMSNAKKREISEQFKAARDDLRAASKAAMASSRAPPKTPNEASGS
ncbi:hypothetical protein MY4038_007593 [Beauveria bassiana]